jgi:hypothetical protein
MAFFFIGTVRKFVLVCYTMCRPQSEAADTHDTGCFVFCAFDCIALPALTLYSTLVADHDSEQSKCLKTLQRANKDLRFFTILKISKWYGWTIIISTIFLATYMAISLKFFDEPNWKNSAPASVQKLIKKTIK